MNLIPRNFLIDDIFDDFMPSKQNSLKCDIYEKNGDYHIEMDIPGYGKEDIKIEVNNDELTIVAEKSDEKTDESKKYIHKERSYGKYQRSFYLKDLNSDLIEAEFKNGVLKITVPKIKETENKRIIDIK